MQMVFEYIKAALYIPPVLLYPDLGKSCIITTEASRRTIGAVLPQNITMNSNVLSNAPIVVFKTTREIGPTFEREARAVIFALKTSDYICFLIRSNDHRTTCATLYIQSLRSTWT